MRVRNLNSIYAPESKARTDFAAAATVSAVVSAAAAVANMCVLLSAVRLPLQSAPRLCIRSCWARVRAMADNSGGRVTARVCAFSSANSHTAERPFCLCAQSTRKPLAQACMIIPRPFPFGKYYILTYIIVSTSALDRPTDRPTGSRAPVR